MISARWLLRY